MSLDYDFGKIKNWRAVVLTDDERIKPKTDRLIWGCMHMGMRNITEKNVDEWVWRLSAYAQVNHYIGYVNEVGWIPDREFLEAHIGLETNVSQESRASFMKRQIIPEITEIADAAVKKSHEKPEPAAT